MLRTLVVLAVMISAIGSVTALAQTGTPVAGGCNVAPRTDEEAGILAERAATPTGELFPASVRLPGGEPIEEETIELLLATLNEADACAQARDLLRFLALYTDDFIVSSIFAPETAGVAPGEQPAGQEDPAATPSATPVTVIDDAVLLEDGRIAAHVFTTGSVDFGSIVWFEFIGERWLIDDIQRSADPPAGTTTIPAGAEGIVGQVIVDAAQTAGRSPEEIELVSIKAVDWPDAGLGCPEEGGVYAAVITPGFRIIVSDGSTTMTYHTDSASTIVRCMAD